MDPGEHPFWCDRDRCTAAIRRGPRGTTDLVGEHRSAPKLLTGALWRSEDRPLRLASLWLTESFDPDDGVVVHLGPGLGGAPRSGIIRDRIRQPRDLRDLRGRGSRPRRAAARRARPPRARPAGR